jgi:hypothetical protein
MAVPTSEELQLVEIFRRRILDTQLPSGHTTNQQLVRWIRARENDLDKAEEMLRKHSEWRKSHGIGPSLLLWTPPPFLTSTYPAKLIGFDGEGSIEVTFDLLNSKYKYQGHPFSFCNSVNGTYVRLLMPVTKTQWFGTRTKSWSNLCLS